MDYQDILFDQTGTTVTITLNRPDVMNAFRARTCDEVIHALQRSGWDRTVGVIVITGAGDRAFCTGGDQSVHGDDGYDGRGTIGLPVEDMQSLIRDVPKPVIAKVRGYAIGGGNVLAAICDLTLASDAAIFGQVGPKMGSVDPGWGTAYLARVVGEKKAREMWFLCRRYSALEAKEMGLVNEVVADADLDRVVDEWCNEISERSPTALAIAKKSLNIDTESIRAIGGLGFETLRLFYGTEESKEGGRARAEKRPPDFRKYTD